MSKCPYHLNDNEEGEQTIYMRQKPMSNVKIVSELSDLYYENERLKQRLSNLREKLVRFVEKEVSDGEF